MLAFYYNSNGEKNLLNGAIKGNTLGLPVASSCAPAAEITPATKADRPVAF